MPRKPTRALETSDNTPSSIPRPARSTGQTAALRAASAPRSGLGPSASTITCPTSRKSDSSKPRIVAAGVPILTPEATVGGRSSKGTVLRLTVSFTSARRSSASLPDHSVERRSSWSRCVSVPPVSTSSPPSCSVSASTSAFLRTWPWYSRKASVAAILKHAAFAAIVCINGPPWMPGKTARSTACACSSSQRMKPAREVDLEPVRQMATVRELEREDRVAWLQRRHVDGHVGLGARMRLHVRMLGAEELLRPVDRQLFNLVDDLAAAVVPFPRIALGVLVRRHAADCLEDARP